MARIYIDMDDTMCDFMGMYNKKLAENPEIKYPQSQAGFFTSLEPLPGAIEGVKKLCLVHDVYILTRPSIKNPLCYTEKRLWIEKYFGEAFCERLIICPDKGLMLGDYLIDDLRWQNFQGKQILFGNPLFKDWAAVLKYFEVS